ncbi:MAG TPA: class I SAM-dependent methyltransferase [Acidobacteriaceae bacterium]|nr:class I SAM-dependent methyltransferase [Acidobacteriaceae bacterium]
MPTISIAGGDTATPLNLAKRLSIIAEHVSRPARILDAGCGAGCYVQALGGMGYEVVGVEYLASKVAAWQSRNPGDPRVHRADIALLPFRDESFDAVILNEVLEHVPDDRAVLTEVARVLRWRGLLLVFSPNRRFPFETHGLHHRTDGHSIPPVRTFGFPWLPAAIGERLAMPWARNYWPSELQRLVRASGFHIYRTTYVWQTFENISRARGRLLTASAPLLRRVANALERLPLLRTFGASQVIIAEKLS